MNDELKSRNAELEHRNEQLNLQITTLADRKRMRLEATDSLLKQLHKLRKIDQE